MVSSNARRVIGAALCLAAVCAVGCSGSSGGSGGAPPLEVREGAVQLTDGDSVSAVATSPALPDLLFALEQGGALRVFDVAQDPPAVVRDIPVGVFDASGFPTAAAGLLIDDESVGGKVAGFATSTGTTSGGGSRHALYLFDTASASTPTATIDLAGLSLVATGLQTSTGTADPVFAPSDPGAQALALVGDTIYVGCASLMPQSYLDNFPGVVLGFALDPTDHTRFASGVTQPAQVIYTRGFNVTGLRAAVTPGGDDVVYVTTTGAGRSYFQAQPFQTSPPEALHAFLEVLDPAKGEIAGVYAFGPAGARNAAAVSPDRLEAVVGRGDFGFARGELFRVSLLDTDLAIANGGASPMDLSGGILDGVADPIAMPFANAAMPPTGRFVSALAYSADGRQLFAISFNDSTVNAFDVPRGGKRPRHRRQVRLSRGSETAQTFGPNASVMALRPGTPGVDFHGPDLWVGTIGVVVDPQTFTTRAEIDAITTY
jgi:hypothetical protein